MERTTHITAPAGAPRTGAARPLPGWTIPVVLLVDMLLVTSFVAIGQREHTTQDGVLGLLATASPFLLGLLVSSFALGRGRPQRWVQVWPAGIGVWLGTLAIGLVLRVMLDQGGAPLPFVLVASGTLAVFLLGRRALCRLLPRRG